MFRKASIAYICAALIGVIGCSSEVQESTASSAKKGQYQIAGIVFQEDQFFRLIQMGMNAGAESAGAEMLHGNSANRPDKEIQLVNTYIARGVDAIVVSPISTTASATALQKAKDEGIVIVTYNLPLQGDIAASYIESDQYDLGRQSGEEAAKYIEANIEGTAQVGIIRFQSLSAEQSNARTSGFIDAIRKLPNVDIVAEQDAWLPEAAVKKASDILTANPDLDIIFAANEGGTIGSVMAVRNANKAGKVAVFGIDASEQLIEFILSDDNILQATTAQQPFEIGQAAVEAAVKAIEGQEVEPKVIMKGTLLSRSDPEAVKEYRERLKELIGRGQ